ncbi:hypothetical protein C4577_01100 [Candidatus Parcubacteria bacterium]|nr:MAG: hypothetical protein C4577_01100 [Candidatus Parcubacteria bacterium]
MEEASDNTLPPKEYSIDEKYEIYKRIEDMVLERKGPELHQLKDIHRVIDDSPALVEKYLPLFEKAHPDSILDIIDKIPEYADSLLEIFTQIPDLVSVYAYYSHALSNTSLEERANDIQLPGTRISASPNPEAIKKRIEKAKALNRKLVSKMEKQEQREIAHPFEVSTIRLTRVKAGIHASNPNFDAVAIDIVPTQPEDYDFLSKTVKIHDSGIINTQGKFGDWRNLGYCFKDEVFNEESFVETIADGGFNSEALTTSLEELPSLEPLLS